MKKRLIVTIMLGQDPSFEFVKRAFKGYAKKVNADFLCITEPSLILNNNNNKLFFAALFQKISLGNLSDIYERVLYLDADILITPHAKNIFDHYHDKTKIYMLNEGLTCNRKKELELISQALGASIRDLNYFNSGVILFPKNNQFLKAIRIHDLEFFVKNSNWFDQTYINFKVRLNSLKTENMDKEFNKMGNLEDFGKRFLASFIHYSGNGYCPKKHRPVMILKDYCYLYNYVPTLKEQIIFRIQYINFRFLRILNKFL